MFYVRQVQDLKGKHAMVALEMLPLPIWRMDIR